MYYGYRCYNSQNKPLGWLYTYCNNTEIAWTNRELSWCKRWKTKRGALDNFDRYNSLWQFKSKGIHLKIEVMPSYYKFESDIFCKQSLLEKNCDDDIQETTNFEFKLVRGLPEKHGTYLFLLEDGSIKEGYFGSFPYPNHEKDIRIANCEDGQFYYTNCVGWLKKLE